MLRGKRVQGLIRYLYGPGRHGEHHNPHIVAGFRTPAALEPAMDAADVRDFRRLDALLTQPLALLGDRNYSKPVWHLSLRAAPEDPVLTDERWAEIAREVMTRTGLAPDGDAAAVRWIAVRHADDHVHIVATLARADGERPDVWNDGYRIRDACRAVEERYGLRRTAPADRTAARRPKRAETEKAARRGRTEPVRSTLRRHVLTAAAEARTEDEFFAALQTEGVAVRKRYSTRTAGEVTGYAVALADDLAASGRPVWYGGGKLASDLTLPKLRHRWAPERGASPELGPLSGRNVSARTARAVLRTAVRRAADEARTVDGFLERLQDEGVLVKRRFSQLDPGQLTGYAVALPTQSDDEEPLWHTGGRLAADLTLPRLRRRWTSSPSTSRERAPGDDLNLEERQAFYEDAARAAAHATAQIRRHMATNPYAAQDACWAASDTLHVAAKATGNQHLRRAAEAYDRAARTPHGHIPRSSPAGNALRTAARILVLAGSKDPGTIAVLLLVGSLIALLDTIAHVRRLQHRQPQADAARRAAHHLERVRTPTGEPPAAWFAEPDLTYAQGRPAMDDFPRRWAPTTGIARSSVRAVPPQAARNRDQSR
ncbi:relaxase/mobilization nuclease domain-containing protein [Actinomadura sp. WMMB 499]|uniref:relaxase/mobilization nuclease domain-containing protein n=1 Tax=Actinomadura sp. WMMB 499 TaxID=1219491 RepID=UPI0012457BCD|nr:relaxase/mobilization nuclease domain-containing protein [Actinomadura sp. WMMB 499]QFG22894.1 relaxase/mobilization nuclease domain-containing protein [Actinomadura sp. WMMB 499]